MTQAIMKEYKTTKGYALFVYLFAPILIVSFSWLLILPFQNSDFTPDANWFLIPIAIFGISKSIFEVIDVYKGRIIIQKDCIKSIGIFSITELKFDEIKGFTVNEKYIFVEPINETQKSIKISKYISGRGEIRLWLSQNFPDLEIQTSIDEEHEILNNENIGLTRKIREQKLLKARQTARILNWSAGIIMAWALFDQTPYLFLILTAAIIPIIALVATKFSEGLIKIDTKDGSAYPSVTYALICSPLGLLLLAFFNYDIFDYSNIWLPSLILTAVLLFLLLFKQQEITFKKKLDYFNVSFLALFFFGYSYGIVIHINCYYDNSQAEHYTATVLDKRIGSGKSTSYYLKLSTWDKQNEIEELSVGKGLYDRIEVGKELNIYIRNGLLKIPWFTVSDE